MSALCKKRFPAGAAVDRKSFQSDSHRGEAAVVGVFIDMKVGVGVISRERPQEISGPKYSIVCAIIFNSNRGPFIGKQNPPFQNPERSERRVFFI